MNRPNFFILGAKKCGTTALHHYLGQHPEVYMSIPKEPIFFEAEYYKGLDYYWEQYFSGWQGEKAVGEARHRNLFLPYVPKRIQESIPNPRFIVIVRNPIKRAFSDWLNMYASGHETLSFEDALYEDIKRMQRGITFEGEEGAHLWAESLTLGEGRRGGGFSKSYHSYVESGYYSLQIRRYFELFPRERLKIVSLEDLAQNPQLVVSAVWSFLGVDPDIQLVDSKPQNTSVSLFRVQVVKYVRRVKVLQTLPRSVKSFGLRLSDSIGARMPTILPSVKEFLVDHYYEHNRDLEKLTGRDLSHWDE